MRVDAEPAGVSERGLHDRIDLNRPAQANRNLSLMTHVLIGTDQSIWCARQFRPAQVMARLGGFGLGVAAFGTS